MTLQALRLWLHGQLHDLAADLGWTVDSPQITAVIAETLSALGVTVIGEVADVRRLKLIARRELWRAVADATVSYADATNVDGIARRYSQIHVQAMARFASSAEEVKAVTPPSSGANVTGYPTSVPNEVAW